MRIMSEKLQHNYIYSYKPTPSQLAVPKVDEEFIRKGIREALQITRDNCTEFIMKDNHTLCDNPENIKTYVRIFREEVNSL